MASQSPAQVNVFGNPGFETGYEPWFSLEAPSFLVSEAFAHGGQSSAFLRMRAGPQAEKAKVFSLVQEVTPDQLPEVVSGNYLVAKWTRGTPLQYLQFVVIAFGAKNKPDGYPNHQIRYLMAGIDREPFRIDNARFVFLSREDPPMNKWVPFQVNVRDDFRKLWGAVPEDYEKIRVLFEARYDDKALGERPEADVYYDDLYFGPAK